MLYCIQFLIETIHYKYYKNSLIKVINIYIQNINIIIVKDIYYFMIYFIMLIFL